MGRMENHDLDSLKPIYCGTAVDFEGEGGAVSQSTNFLSIQVFGQA